MSDAARVQRQIADLRSIRQGLESRVSSCLSKIAAAERSRAQAGRFPDALERAQGAEAEIRRLRSDVDSSLREITRVETQIRGLEAELRSRR